MKLTAKARLLVTAAKVDPVAVVSTLAVGVINALKHSGATSAAMDIVPRGNPKYATAVVDAATGFREDATAARKAVVKLLVSNGFVRVKRATTNVAFEKAVW